MTRLECVSDANTSLEDLGRELERINSSKQHEISYQNIDQLRKQATEFIKEHWPTILSSACYAWNNADPQKRKEAIDEMVKKVTESLPHPYNISSIASPIIAYLISQDMSYLCDNKPQSPPVPS